MRNLYWDGWKGIAIVAVVFIHACSTAFQFEPGTWNHNFGLLLRQMINFPVGLFVFIAAFFVGTSSKEGSSYLDKVKARLLRLAVPYLVWAAIYSFVRIATGTFSFSELLPSLADGTVVSVGYYVIVMLQIAIVSPFLELLSLRVLKWMVPLTVVSSCAFTYAMHLSGYEGVWSRFPYNALPFFVWIPFYFAGLFVARSDVISPVWLSRRLVGVGFGAMVLLSIAEAMTLLRSVPALGASQLKLTSVGASLFLCLIAVSWAREVVQVSGVSRVLVWLGSRSYYFYLSHILILGKVKVLAVKASGLYGMQVAFVPLVAVATLIICALGAVLADQIFAHHKGVRRALGLA